MSWNISYQLPTVTKDNLKARGYSNQNIIEAMFGQIQMVQADY